MNSVTAQIEINVAEIETRNEEAADLTIDQLSLIAGGQCTTNSI